MRQHQLRQRFGRGLGRVAFDELSGFFDGSHDVGAWTAAAWEPARRMPQPAHTGPGLKDRDAEIIPGRRAPPGELLVTVF